MFSTSCKRGLEATEQAETKKHKGDSTTAPSVSISTQSAVGCQTEAFLDPVTTIPLTRSNLRFFESMTSTGRSDSRKRTRVDELSTADTPPSVSASNYRQFIRALDASRIFTDDIHTNEPRNAEDIRMHLSKPRLEQPYTDVQYEQFRQKLAAAPNELTMLIHTSSLLIDCNDTERARYQRMYDQNWDAFPVSEAFGDGNFTRKSVPRPDLVEGYVMDPSELSTFPIRTEVDASTIPTSSRFPLCLPHLAVESKGPAGNAMTAKGQLAWVGACMVYAREKTLEYLGIASGGQAEVFTFSINPENLVIYSNHRCRVAGRLEYYQRAVFSGSLNISKQELMRVLTAVRNTQERARDNARDLIEKCRVRFAEESIQTEAGI